MATRDSDERDLPESQPSTPEKKSKRARQVDKLKLEIEQLRGDLVEWQQKAELARKNSEKDVESDVEKLVEEGELTKEEANR